MQVSNFNSNLSLTTNSYGNLKAMKNGTKECWMSPFSQMFTIQEATPQQKRFIDQDLRGSNHGWGSLAPEQAAARRDYIREDLAAVRPDSKVLVMTPKRCPTTIDEIYCTVSLHRREILLAGGDKAPRLVTGFVVHGVVVPAAIRMSGYATAMMRRLIGDKHAADAQTVFNDDLRQWLCIGQPEVCFSGWFDPAGISAHLWGKFGESTPGYRVTIPCDRIHELRPNAALMSTHRKLSMDQTIKAIEHHNELAKREWFEKYEAKPFERDMTSQMLAPLEDYVCRARLRTWTAETLGVKCPTTWGIELHEPGHDEWAYIAFVHCFEESNLHILTYHAKNEAALHALLYLACTAEDIVADYNPSRILIRPVSESEFQNAPGSDLFTRISRGFHRVAMVIGAEPGVRITDVGLKLHEQDVRHC